jgi:hypothetical protein
MTVSGCSAWASTADLPSTVLDLHSPVQWCLYLEQATDILWSLSGRRWSGPPVAATAVLRAATPRMGEPGWPYHQSWGQCACYLGTAILGPLWSLDVHSHHEPVSVRLPHDDVTTVSTVTVDGAAFTAWQLDGSWLTRTDGRGWPACHDRAVVTYLHGRPPPRGGVAACVALAVEFGRAGSSNPDKACSCRSGYSPSHVRVFHLSRWMTELPRQGPHRLYPSTCGSVDQPEGAGPGRAGLVAVASRARRA